MLAVGGLAASTFSQQDDGLVLASGQEVPVGSLGHAVNMRGRVFPPAALEHLHHLRGISRGEGGGSGRRRLNRRPHSLI